MTSAAVASVVKLMEGLPEAVQDEVAEHLRQYIDEITEDDGRWDALLATEDSQRLLEKMADEALTEVQAGRVRPMVFTDDGPPPTDAGRPALS